MQTRWQYRIFGNTGCDIIIKFGDFPEIWPNALLEEFKFDDLPEWVLIMLKLWHCMIAVDED